MSKLKVALLQLLSAGYDQNANLAKGLQYCRMAKQLGADIALFPEMWNIGYQLPDSSLPEQIEYWQQQQFCEFLSQAGLGPGFGDRPDLPGAVAGRPA